MQIDVSARGARDFTQTPLELGVPHFEDGYALMWVDRDAPLAALSWVVDVAHAHAQSGGWAAVAEQHDLVGGTRADGQPGLSGHVMGRALSLGQLDASGIHLTLAVPQGLYPRPGTGGIGDPVMDLLVESSGVPAEAREAVLALVHGRGACIEQGELRLCHLGPLAEIWPEVLGLLEALEDED